MSKPQGSTTITSGSCSQSCSQVIHGECRPAVPKRLTPPAISTNSGIQLPAAVELTVTRCDPGRSETGRGDRAPEYFGEDRLMPQMHAIEIANRDDRIRISGRMKTAKYAHELKQGRNR